MRNNFEYEIWESLLKAAVIKNSLDELENYSPEEISKTTLPAHYDQKMQRLVQRLHYKNAIRNSLFYVKKIVVLLFILMGISFLFLLHFDEVRATCHDVITYIYEKYILFQHLYPDLCNNFKITSKGKYISDVINTLILFDIHQS